MSHAVRLVAATAGMLTLAACTGRASPNDGAATDATIPSLDAAGQACAQHPNVEACLADRDFRCYWGPNYSWPVLVNGEPCEPLDGMCQSELSPPRADGCMVDSANDATCRAHATGDACVADVLHRCWWTPAMGMPCSEDGSSCPPPAHCETRADCPPRCASSGPTISLPAHADCGCLNPPGGVCISAAVDPPVPSGCVERPACDSADLCSCLTGLGTCTPGELPNVCICDGFTG